MAVFANSVDAERRVAVLGVVMESFSRAYAIGAFPEDFSRRDTRDLASGRR
jgi:hypothetical protein